MVVVNIQALLKLRYIHDYGLSIFIVGLLGTASPRTFIVMLMEIALSEVVNSLEKATTVNIFARGFPR